MGAGDDPTRPLPAFGSVLRAATFGHIAWLTRVTVPALAPGSPTSGPPTSTGTPSWAAFDSWVWAQTALESGAGAEAATVDADGRACEVLPIQQPLRAHLLGVTQRCSGSGYPADATPAPAVVEYARTVQPDQEQFEEAVP